MTKKSIAVIYLFLFAAGALASWLYNSRAAKLRDTELCSTSIIVYYKDIRANLTLDFMYTLKKQAGIVAVSGTYAKNDRVIGVIRRDVSYIWTENKDSFHFFSVKVNKLANNESISDDAISEVLPDFYVYPEKSINYSILTQGQKGFMFTVGKRPIFFCAR